MFNGDTQRTEESECATLDSGFSGGTGGKLNRGNLSLHDDLLEKLDDGNAIEAGIDFTRSEDPHCGF